MKFENGVGRRVFRPVGCRRRVAQREQFTPFPAVEGRQETEQGRAVPCLLPLPVRGQVFPEAVSRLEVVFRGDDVDAGGFRLFRPRSCVMKGRAAGQRHGTGFEFLFHLLVKIFPADGHVPEFDGLTGPFETSRGEMPRAVGIDDEGVVS